MLRFRGWWYAIWTLFFKHHGIPPKSGSRFQYFFGFAVFIALDLLLTINICFHLFNPVENWQTIGVPFLFISPFATILGPLAGVLACCIASPKLLKF